MKVLICSQYYYPENFAITKIAEKLISFGNEVTVLTGRPNYGFNGILNGYENIKEETINGVKVIRLKIKPRKKNKLSVIFNYLSYYFLGKRWARKTKEKYDVVLSMSLSPVTILGPANVYKKRFKCKHVCYCVDLWPESVLITKAVKKTSLFYKILFKLSQSLYSKCDEIMIGSPSFEDYFNTVLKLKNIKIECVPQTSLLEDISDISPKRFDDYFDIVYCGNIGTIQGIEKVPEIMSFVKNDNVRFHIIGLGSNVPKLEEEIKKYNIENKVIFHGPKPIKEAAPFLLGSDAFYVSLLNEGYVGKTIPNKLNMYMALKKPIIGVFDGDAKNVLIESHAGYTCDENPEFIAKTIDKLSSLSKDQLEVFGNNARKFYLEKFSQDSISKRIFEILKENI